MSVYEGNGWKITPLAGWEVETEGSISTIYHPDGVGAMQISLYTKEGEVTESDLLELAGDHIEAGAKYKTYEEDSHKVLTLAFASEGVFWQYWYVALSTGALFISYNCDETDREIELEKVKSMVATVGAT